MPLYFGLISFPFGIQTMNFYKSRSDRGGTIYPAPKRGKEFTWRKARNLQRADQSGNIRQFIIFISAEKKPTSPKDKRQHWKQNNSLQILKLGKVWQTNKILKKHLQHFCTGEQRRFRGVGTSPPSDFVRTLGVQNLSLRPSETYR